MILSAILCIQVCTAAWIPREEGLSRASNLARCVWHPRGALQRAESTMLAFFLFFTLLVFLVPFTLAPGQVTDLSGRVGNIDNGDQLASMNPLAAAIYWLGDANCHQIAERSFFLNGNQMPFCARDVSIFAGLVIGSALALFAIPRPNLWLVMLGFVPIALDGGAQIMLDYQSSNLLRAITGLLAGFCVAMLLHLFATKTFRKSDLAQPSPDDL